MYTRDMTFSDWAAQVCGVTNQVKYSMENAVRTWQKFYTMTYGLTDVQILALPAFSGRTQADLDAIRICLNTLKQIADAMNGAAALAQYDYNSYFIPFVG